jgi:serralysin
MKYPGQNHLFSTRSEPLQDLDFAGGPEASRIGGDRFAFADVMRATRASEVATHRAASLVAPSANDWLADSAIVSNPRGDLNETPGANGSIGSAQAIDRAGLSVTNNSNLYDTSLPSLVIQGSVSSPSDEDYFSITLQAGELLVLDVDGTDGLDSLLHLFGPNGGTEIGDNDDYIIIDPGSETAATHTADHHNTDSLIHFRAATAGTYYFSIGAFQENNPANTTSGIYQINVSIGPPGTAAQIAAEDIQALQSGASWNHTNISYGFPTAANQYPGSFVEANPASDFSPFNATQINATIAFLQMIANVSAVTFTQDTATPGNADLRYAMTSDASVGNTAFAYYPTNAGHTQHGGDAWFSTSNFNTPTKGNYAWMGILHETGHALGLKHGQEFPIALSADHDSTEFSVMTYRSYPGQPPNGYTNETWGYPQTLMMYDIAALQAIYGANFNTNSGDSVYTWNAATGEMSINGVGQGAPGNGAMGVANRVFLTVWDGGGIDTYDMHVFSAGMLIDLTPGGWSKMSSAQIADLGNGHYARGNVFNALQYNGDPRSLIENAIGGPSADTIIGNAADNRLEGRGGDDQLFGMDGNDAFYFTWDFNALDHVDGGAGNNDQIGLQGDYAGPNALTLGANTITGVEVIAVLPGFSYDLTTVDANVPAGGLLKVQATLLTAGQSLTFNGSAESDGTFIIFGGQGNDHFTGGAGGDGFYFGPGGFNGSDLINGGAGTNDQLALDGNYTITMGGNVSNVEVLVFLPGPGGQPNTFNVSTAEAFVAAGQTMTVFGLQVSTGITFDGSNEHDGAFKIYGGSAGDTLSGGSGADWLFGSAGGDMLTGGAGADTFYYDDVSQSTSTGFDRLFGFDDNADKIDLPFAVTAFAGASTGALSTATFDSDLGSALAGLASHQAGMFTATSGDFNGQSFLVIDANGVAGYQAGADYVIEFVSPVTPIDPNLSIFI